MDITGLGVVAVCGAFPAAISRYYWIRPELTQAGLKILAKGSLIGIAMQTTAIVVAIIGFKTTPIGANSEQKDTRFCVGYTIAMVASIPVSVALAEKFNFRLSCEEAATTAALAWVPIMSLVKLL
ncbi:MAG: hypothetical protein KBA81_03415 [Rhabdochlamydiaceae bacterium]|nr:hypothetical protein [Rhabdochlamydiaceae bacterium]